MLLVYVIFGGSMSSGLFFLLIGGLAWAIVMIGLYLFVSSDVMTDLLINIAVRRWRREERMRLWYVDIPR